MIYRYSVDNIPLQILFVMNIFLPAFILEFCILNKFGIKQIRAGFVTVMYVLSTELRFYVYVL